MSQDRSDPLLAALVAIRDMRRYLTNAECAIRDAMEERGRIASHAYAPPTQEHQGMCSDDEPPGHDL